METEKKIQVNTTLLIVCCCFLTALCTIGVGYHIYQPPPSQQQQQNVYIGNDRHMTNINTANIDELKQLPGIGDKKAQLIISNRPYKTIYELKSINGIGDDTFSKIEEVIEP